MVVVVSSAQMEPARELVRAMGLSVTVVRGGARRRDSVLMGLDAMRDVKWIAVHDAARPLVSADLLQRGFSAAEGSGVAVPVIPVSDTIKRVEGDRVVGTVPRADLRAVQTPQIFRRDILAWALSTSDDDVTDEAGLVESLGGIVYTFRGDPVNFKLTYPEDLLLMREILRRPAMDAR
jgi:2-C-methyl-D-erythritol 4-phosphate cytidylyltransferase